MRVLVLEDDGDTRLAVEKALRVGGFAVDTAANLSQADQALSVNDYDCAVFDRMLPTGDSLRYVADRRAGAWAVPVLFLTGRDGLGERLEGLMWGDDYLVKPFAVAELIVRVRSLCRWPAPDPAPVARFGDIELDPGQHEARRAGAPLDLTAKEFTVLHCLLAAGGEQVLRRDLEKAAWDELVPPTSNVLDVLMVKLRGKLGDPPVLHTVRGTGYLLR